MPTRAPKNAKARRSRSPPSGSQKKRLRRLTPKGANVNNRNAQQSQIQNMDSDATQKWAKIVASVINQPYDSQVQQYKEWRRAGSKHDDHCCICPGPQRLVECHTCKIAFHPECLPRFSHILPNVAFHCSICVDRCWDLSPPDTLPGSLEPSSAQIHYPPTRTTTDKPNDASNPYLRDPTQQEGLRTQSATSVYEHRGTDRSTSHDIAHPGPAVQTATESPQRTEHQRNLDYTLSSDVFSSLYRLYRELESVASLRAEIEELRSQNTRFAEIIKVNRRFRDILLEGVRSPQIMGTQFVGTVESISDTFADLEVELGITEGQTVPAKEPK